MVESIEKWSIELAHWYKKDWVKHLSFWNEVIGSHIGRFNSIYWNSTGACFFLCWLLECYEWPAQDWIIVQLLLIRNQVNTISLAAILGGKMHAEGTGFKQLAPTTTECSIQSLFWDHGIRPCSLSEVLLWWLSDAKLSQLLCFAIFPIFLPSLKQALYRSNTIFFKYFFTLICWLSYRVLIFIGYTSPKTVMKMCT